MESKFRGIDSRDIKCCCTDANCIGGGISIEEDWLFFHFLDTIQAGDKKILHQTSKAMVLNRETRDELVKRLKQIKFPKKIMEKEEKYVVIRRTFSVENDNPCKKLIIDYLLSKNAYGIEVWTTQISEACRIPIKYALIPFSTEI